MTGKERRLKWLVPGDRAALWLPLDDGLISGPEEHLRDPRSLLRPEIVEHVDAVLGFRGVFNAYWQPLAATSLIVNLTASTTRGEHTRKVLVGNVVDAIRDGADAVACHINVSSPYESEQLQALAQVVADADTLGIPVVALAYPRGRRDDGSDQNYLANRDGVIAGAFTRLTRHCVRIAVELGASAVKTIYTGSEESFKTVVDSALGVPVVIAGESPLDEDEAIAKAQSAIRAGAAGVAYGRQIFTRAAPAPFVRKLRNALDDTT